MVDSKTIGPVVLVARPNVLNFICDSYVEQCKTKGVSAVADAAYNNAIASLAFLQSVTPDYGLLLQGIIDLVNENAQLLAGKSTSAGTQSKS